MEKYKKLFSNTGIYAIGTFASKFLVFFMLPFYTACLLPEEYGTADLISQTANLIIPFACSGISDGIFRFAMDKNEDKKKVFSSGITVLLVCSAVFLILSPLIGLYPTLQSHVWLVVLYVLAANFHSAVAQYIRALEKTVLFSVGGILGTAITVAFNIVFLLGLDMGVEGYILSVILGDVLVTAFLLPVSGVWRDISFRLADKEKIRQMLKYSIPMIPTTIFWWITSVADRFMIISMKGAEINGLYAAAYKAPTLLTLVCTVFIEAWQLSAVSENDETERSVFFGKVFAGFQGVLFMAASALVMCSKLVTEILLADSYYDSWQYIPVLSLAMTYSSLVTFLGSVYMVRKKSIYSFLTAAVGAVVNVVLNFVLIPHWSAMGAAVATFFSYFVVMVIRGINTRRFVRFKLGVPILVFNTAAVVLQGGIMIAEPTWWVPAQLILFAAVLVINGKNILHAVILALRNYRGKNNPAKGENYGTEDQN